MCVGEDRGMCADLYRGWRRNREGFECQGRGAIVLHVVCNCRWITF